MVPLSQWVLGTTRSERPVYRERLKSHYIPHNTVLSRKSGELFSQQVRVSCFISRFNRSVLTVKPRPLFPFFSQVDDPSHHGSILNSPVETKHRFFTMTFPQQTHGTQPMSTQAEYAEKHTQLELESTTPGLSDDKVELAIPDDAATKLLTRKVLFKLDTRYALCICSSFPPLSSSLLWDSRALCFIMMKHQPAYWSFSNRLLPVLALMFLCSFLDRTNVGNSKILGLEKDIGISSNQYANGLAIFFAFYIAAELPSNLVLKKARPRLWLALLTVSVPTPSYFPSSQERTLGLTPGSEQQIN